jgi:hypothetical protein
MSLKQRISMPTYTQHDEVEFSLDKLRLKPHMIEQLFMTKEQYNTTAKNTVNVHLHFVLPSIDIFVELLQEHLFESENYTEWILMNVNV